MRQRKRLPKYYFVMCGQLKTIIRSGRADDHRAVRAFLSLLCRAVSYRLKA